MSESPAKKEMRPAPAREESSRERATRIAAEVREHNDGMDDGTDKFLVDPRAVPDGWAYEWKRRTVFNQEDPSYQVSIARKGWTAVPASRHPEYMPMGHKGNVIERDGLVLMERPKELVDEARELEQREAKSRVSMLEQKLSGVAPGQFDRTSDPRVKPRVKTSFEPGIPIPD